MTPANLHDAVREAYARGKESDDSATIEQAIAWGRVAFDMTMTDVVREEILSTVARAQISVGKWKDADETSAFRQAKGYGSGKIGRASGRERGCRTGRLWGAAGT